MAAPEWKRGNLERPKVETWKAGNTKSGNPETWRVGNTSVETSEVETQTHGNMFQRWNRCGNTVEQGMTHE